MIYLITLGMSAWMVSALPVMDQDFGCTDSAKAQGWVREFSVDVESYGGMELCNSAVDVKKLFNDFELIQDGTYSQTGSNAFIRDFVPQQNYFAWLRDQVRGMDRGHDIPYATAYNSWGFITMQDGWAKLSTLGRVGTLIHEARHTEGYGHIRCTQGPYQGSSVSGCDSSLNYGGSHGVEMEYYARVSVRGQNFHPAYQSMARAMLLARANFVFNQSAMDANEALIIRSDDRLTRILGDQAQVWQWSADHPLTYQLKRSSFGLTLLSQNMEAIAIEMQNDGIWSYSDDYSYFKMLKLYPSSHLRDLEEFDYGTQRYVFGLANDQTISSFAFPSGAWGTSRSAEGLVAFKTVSPEGRRGIFGLFNDHTYCALDIQRLQCVTTRQPWPEFQKTFVVWDNQLLSLGHDGRVRINQGEEWSTTQGSNVLDILTTPRYDVFE